MAFSEDRTAAASARVSDLMTSGPTTCGPDTNVASAAASMMQADCGILPVVKDGKLVGVVTDRDMFIALATRNQLASQMRVGEVAGKVVWTCNRDDDIRTALATMKQHRVRRLPVVDAGGALVGILSMNDIVLETGPAKGLRSDAVLDTMQSICAHHQDLAAPAEAV